MIGRCRLLGCLGLLLGSVLTESPVWGADTPAPSPPIENVVVVTWDGFRTEDFFGGAQGALLNKADGGVADRVVPDVQRLFGAESAEERRARLLPFVWGTIAREGQIFGDRAKRAPATLTNGKKFSYPGYNEMFCGFGDDRIDSNGYVANPNPSVFEFLHAQPAFRGRVAAFATWDLFPSILRSDRNGLLVHTAFQPIVDPPLTPRQTELNDLVNRLPRIWPDNGFDVVTLGAAREHLIRHHPRVLYIGLGETDEWAHARRYDLYLTAAHAGDRDLGDLWQVLQTDPQYKGRTALILTTDHGRGTGPRDWTNHNATTDGAEFIWLAVLAPGTVLPLGVRADVTVTQSQVAATIAHLLGTDFQRDHPRAAPPLPGLLKP